MTGSFITYAIVLAAWRIVVASPTGPQFVQAGEVSSDQFSTCSFYTVPNPFKQRQDGFYLIKSVQTIISSHMKRKQFEVEDYFSLDAGLSFSVHRPRQSDGSEAWVTIGDGQRGRSYIVRNIDATETEQMDCELDHAHDHRQVFPWQYEYDLVLSEEQRKKKTKGRRKKNDNASENKIRVAIYGLGAIWLNAIKRNIKSDRIGDCSDYTTNIWSFTDHALSIDLLFDKLDESERSSLHSIGDIQAALDRTNLSTIKVHHDDLIAMAQEHHTDLDGITSRSFEYNTYIVSEFSAGLQVDKVDMLQRLKYQLELCHHSNKKHRTFPSLMRELSRSPQRLFHLVYIARKYALYKDGRHSGDYDESRHRYLFSIEHVIEMFSFTKEVQLEVYEPLPVDNRGQIDVYMKVFTGREVTRSSRHSTVHYHLIRKQDGQRDSCKVGEMEPVPKNSIFVRPIHFYRPNSVVLSGHLTGLSAMMLNVADIHYKSFGLTKRKINVTQNPYDLDETREVSVDEWQVADKRAGWTYQFFFERAPKGSNKAQSFDERVGSSFSSLVRVDIRETKAIDVSDSVIENSGEDSRNDYDLVAQFDIVQVRFELDKASYETIFTPPSICAGERDGNESDDSDESGYNFKDDYDEYTSDDNDDDKASDRDKLHELEQLEGEQFETGAENEDHQFPDFFDFIDGQPVYLITTRLDLAPEEGTDTGGDKPAGQKHIWLGELVDLERQVSIIDIYYSQQNYEKSKPDEKYYIDYGSELVFRIVADKCKYMTDVDSSWLRLFSDQIVYHTAPDLAGRKPDHHTFADKVVIESNKIRLYGVAALWQRMAQSESSAFMGRKKKVTEKNGTKFKELIWINDEHGMNILFHFLWNMTEYEQDKAQHRPRSPNERLTLDSITFTNLFADGYETKFRPVRAQILALQGRASKLMFIPNVCSDLIVEVERMKHSSVTTEIPMPSFFDFVNKTGAYYASYVIDHVVGVNEPNKPEKRIHSSTRVREMYDLRTNRGRVFVTEDELTTHTLFIEGQQRKVFKYSETLNQCQQFSHLKTLVDLGPELASENVDFDLKKMYGLAAFWIALAGREAKLEVHRFLDPSGRSRETYFYNIRLNVPHAGGQLVQNVRVIFQKRREDIRSAFENEMLDRLPNNRLPKGRDELLLGGITVQPVEKTGNSFPENVGTWASSIAVETITPHVSTDWELPHACQNLVLGADFPKLSNLLSRLTQFHMKSEVSIQYPDGQARFYVLDEWVHGQQIRMRARNLGKSRERNFDFILYGQTAEVFDISVPFNCVNDLPDTELARSEHSGLMDLWTHNTTVASHLSHLYYGPLSMWRLAENDLDNVELATSIELAPIPTEPGDNFDPKSMEIELSTEIWRVKNPNGGPEWSYDMKFIKNSQPAENGTTLEWHTLESVQLTDSDVDPPHLANSLKILVDVVNYRYHVALEDVLEMFLLPDGWGCQRSQSALDVQEFWDEFSFKELRLGYFEQPRVPTKYFYEASLEIIGEILGDDDPNLGPLELSRVMSPTLNGIFWRGGRLTENYNLNFSAHLANINFANGTTLSTKAVFDESKPLIYRIDRMTGICTVSLSQAAYWVLEFPMEQLSRIERVFLDEQLFEMLFLNTAGQNFKMVNNYTLNGIITTTYEKEFSNLTLTSNLYGPAIVMRKFQHDPRLEMRTEYERYTTTKYRLKFKRRDKVSVRVFLFELDKSKLRAILDITMHEAQVTRLSDFINEISVVECYNDGDLYWDKQLASFSLEYQFTPSLRWYASFEQASIKDNFYRNLITNANLSPMQLDGQARIEFTKHDNRMRIHFNVLEAPSAHVYFKECVQSTMTNEMESKAEVKLAASIAECSRWCDQINCLAMSYCRDRTCQVVTERALKSLSKVELTDKMVADSQTSSLCSYYYRNLNQSVVTLDKLINLMTKEVDEMKRHYLFGIVIQASGRSFFPVRFYASKNKFRWGHEDLERPEIEFTQQPSSELVFSTLKRSYFLDVTNLTAINSQENSNYVSIAAHAQSQSKCLEVCERNNCLLVSYCKKLSQCIVIVQGDKSTGNVIIGLKSLMKPAQPNLGCSILIQDHLDKYSKFENTFAPTTHDKRYDNYSVVECSSACQAARENCLSFDLCTSTGKFADQESLATVCLLQKSHVALSTFDRSIFDLSDWAALGDTQNTIDDQEVVCDHYSKSVLQYYNRISNRKLANKLDTANRGLNAEKCAIYCQQDDDCEAFEYCYNDKKHPAQACYFIRKAEILKTNQLESDKQMDVEYLGKQLTISQKCSIFVATGFALEYKLNQSFHSSNPGIFNGSMMTSTGRTDILQSLLIIFGYLIVSTVVGSIIQFAYIRLMGRPVLFNDFKHF